MEKLNFYTVDLNYVQYLQDAEQEQRGVYRKNTETIQHLAERTYKRVLLGKDQGLVFNSCNFHLLEQKCLEYMLKLAHVNA